MTATSTVAFALSAADVAVVVGGLALIAFLVWFFFGEKQTRRAEVREVRDRMEIERVTNACACAPRGRGRGVPGLA